MPTNPYLPPASDISEARPARVVPPEIAKKIKGAWIAGIISGVMTLLVTLVAINGAKVAAFNAWNFLDVFLIFGLAFGIYKKSRACAVSMFVYFIISKILIVLETGSIGGVLLSVIFIYYYGQGIAGTFAYHKLQNE